MFKTKGNKKVKRRHVATVRKKRKRKQMRPRVIHGRENVWHRNMQEERDLYDGKEIDQNTKNR